MGFDDLGKDVRERARAAKTMEDLKELANEDGRALSDEELDSLSGGLFGHTLASCKYFAPCPAATDTRGNRCTSYVFA